MMLAARQNPIEKLGARKPARTQKTPHLENPLWSAVGKNLLRHRAAQNALCSGYQNLLYESDAGAGEGI
jgi:hypothetical protein